MEEEGKRRRGTEFLVSGALRRGLQLLEVALSAALVGMRSLAAQHAQHVAQLTARNKALKVR